MSIIESLQSRTHNVIDFMVISFGFVSIANIDEAVKATIPYVSWFSGFFGICLFGIRIYLTVRDMYKNSKSKNPNSHINGGDDYSQKEIE